MTPESVPVQWEVAGEPGFAKIVAKGETYASADEAHSVHVDIRGLSPARAYWYRFHTGQATSPIGHFRTAPAAGARGGRLRLALASCQQYEQGYYSAHRYLAQDDPDLVVWVGDYIYESSWGGDLVRRHEGAEAVSLEDYRRRYAQYKTDADLQRSHAAAAWAIGWDDHEVSNDYAGEFGEALGDRPVARIGIDPSDDDAGGRKPVERLQHPRHGVVVACRARSNRMIGHQKGRITERQTQLIAEVLPVERHESPYRVDPECTDREYAGRLLAHLDDATRICLGRCEVEMGHFRDGMPDALVEGAFGNLAAMDVRYDSAA